MRRGIDQLDLIVIVGYIAILIAIAAYHSRHLRRQDDMFLAGRSMSRWPIAISMYMAVFSTNSFLGLSGWVNRPDGSVWIGLQTAGIVLSIPLITWLYPTLFFRLRITSAYEYLSLRFNNATRNAATAFFLSSRFMWMGTILYSASLVVSQMVGVTAASGQVWAIVVIGTMATGLALVGGMRAVIWTDVVQFCVLMSGVTLMIVMGLNLSGGVRQVLATAIEFHRLTPPALFSLTDNLSVTSGLLLGFVGMLSMCGADQVLLQQYLTARSDREAKASLWRNGLLLKPVSLIYPALGLILFAYYRSHPDAARLLRTPDDAVPVYIMYVLPTGVRGLITIAMAAAVLTSMQSGLTAVSAAVQVNFLRPLFKRELTDVQAVRLARILLVVSGMLVVGSAVWVRSLGQQNSILQILNIVMYPFTGVLLGIFLLGILTHRANSPGVLIGSAVGFLGTIALPAAKFFWPDWEFAGLLSRISNFYYGFVGAVLTLAVGYAASFAFAAPSPRNIVGLTRRSLPEGTPAAMVGS